MRKNTQDTATQSEPGPELQPYESEAASPSGEPQESLGHKAGALSFKDGSATQKPGHEAAGFFLTPWKPT